jgi:hypothetical protein
VELKGTPGASLDSVKIYVINGNGGTTDDLLSLAGYTIPADSYFVIAQSSNVPNFDINAGGTADYQNSGSSGYNGVDNILLVYDSIGLASRVVLDAVGYGLPATTSADSIFRGEVWPTYDVSPYRDTLTIPISIYFATMARYSPMDLNNNYYDFAHFMVKTPGAANKTTKSVSIYDVQYSTDTLSAIRDTTITCEPLIVTAVFDTIYYVSSATGGEWNGVCVYRDINQTTWSVGDSIRLIHGLVYENYKRTEIRSAGTVLYAMGNDPSVIIPTEIVLGDAGESYEGVLIKLNNVTVVTAPDANGEWKVSNGTDTLTVDNLASYTVPSIGAKINIAGILDYSFGIYKLQPRGNSDITLLFYSIEGTVSLSDAPADSSGTIVTIDEINLSDTTDVHGHFIFPDVPSDTYTFIFEHSGYVTESLIYYVNGGTIMNVTLNKYPTYTLSGIIGLNDNPTDTLGVSVTLRDSLTVVNVETDSSGYYEITGILAGNYSLVILKDYYSQDSLDITISSDTVYNTSLDRLTGTIWGYVGLNNAPADSSGSIVIIDGLMLTDTTDVHGEYGFSGLDLGYTYSLIFQHTDYIADTNDIFLDISSDQYNVTLIQISGITDETVEKVIVENNESGLSFTYNKSVDTPTVMRLYDLTGRNVMTQDIMGSKGVYSLSVNKKLSKGVYFIQITGEEKPFVKKFVIIK